MASRQARCLAVVAESGSGSTQARFGQEGENAVMALHDLTGFDGRCDAVFISNHRVQPESIDSRRPYPSETDGGTYDLVVAGGGVAGMCAAVAAARSGLKVALVHDRPVLGGNNSSEVRVHLGGMICLKPFENLGNLVKEFGHTKQGNAQPAENYEDEKKMAFVGGEENITLLLDTRVVGAETVGTKITSVTAVNCLTGERKLLSSRLFADCTGDASLGCAAGADYFYGREGRAAYGEPSAPEQADSMVLGSSVQWYSTVSEGDCSFPEFEYGMEFL
jgi:Succinate dehydrogenase/fumarate reductase, flavoprotein subunit